MAITINHQTNDISATGGSLTIDGSAVGGGGSGDGSLVTVTSSSGSLTLDLSSGSFFSLTLSENVTGITVSNLPSSGTVQSFTLKVIQASSVKSITWPSAFKWAGGLEPTLSSGNSDVDIFTFFTHDAGSNIYSFVAGKSMA